MKTLSANQVKEIINNNPKIKLVMTLGPRAFSKCHIPGSLNIWDINIAKKQFPVDTSIIVYCSDNTCMASYYAYQQLEKAGFNNIWRFSGGLREWFEAGFKLYEAN